MQNAFVSFAQHIPYEFENTVNLNNALELYKFFEVIQAGVQLIPKALVTDLSISIATFIPTIEIQLHVRVKLLLIYGLKKGCISMDSK